MIDLDVAVFRWLHEATSQTGWLALMCVLTVLGSGWGSFLVVPLLGGKRTRRFALVLSGVLIVNAIVVALLKLLVQRRRPYLALDGVHALVFEAPGGWSFPSGHAAGSFSFATFAAIVLLRGDGYREHPKRRAALAAFLLVAAAGVATSRVALGVHFPGDVLAGALVGAAVGAGGARLYLRRGSEILQA